MNTRKKRYTHKKYTNKKTQKNKTWQQKSLLQKISNVDFYDKTPTITQIEGYKFLFLPQKTNVFQMDCKIFGGCYLETKENLGISHLLEHIVADSWKKCPNSNCTKHLEKYGVLSNAYTQMMSTGYWIKGLSQFKNILTDYIVSICIDPKITNKKMKYEIEAVRNEITNYMNDPNYALTNACSELIFKNEGLKFSENYDIQLNNLSKFTVQQLIDFANEIISRKKMLFIVSGDFSKTQLTKKIKSILKKVPDVKNTENIPYLNENVCYNINKVVKYVKNTKNTNSTIFLHYPLNIYQGDKTLVYIPLITNLLGSGLNSLLLGHLRIKKNLVYGVSVTHYTNFCGTIITIKIFTINKNIDKVLKETFSTIKKYSNTNINETLLKHYKIRYILELQDKCLNKTNAVSSFYAAQYFYQLHKKNPVIYNIRDVTSIIDRINVKDITNLLKQLLNPDKCTLCYSSDKPSKFSVNDF